MNNKTHEIVFQLTLRLPNGFEKRIHCKDYNKTTSGDVFVFHHSEDGKQLRELLLSVGYTHVTEGELTVPERYALLIVKITPVFLEINFNNN